MNTGILLTLSALGGIVLGVIFFGGLWYTVQRGTQAKNPAVWFGLSALLRTAIVLFGLYLIADGQLVRVVVALAGFILARISIIRLTKNPDRMRVSCIKENER